MIRHALSVAVASVLLAAPQARATPSELAPLIEAERPAGCSDYRFLFWDFYRAELWTDARDLPGESYALSLTYRSKFSRDELVEASLDEMARISGRPVSAFGPARDQMARAFRDVVPGDRITAWRAAPGRVVVFVNGTEMGALTDDAELFLSIWLGDKTRHPEGRTALLDGRCDG
ncbi:MAG: chalcone isomerase family protein [Thermohalobaculum sp.]|nr:chalcone isomerase family protein [Thermohalobaculum sp.]